MSQTKTSQPAVRVASADCHYFEWMVRQLLRGDLPYVCQLSTFRRQGGARPFHPSNRYQNYFQNHNCYCEQAIRDSVNVSIGNDINLVID